MLATSNARTQTGFKGFDDLNLKNYLNISTDNVSITYLEFLKVYFLDSENVLSCIFSENYDHRTSFEVFQ